MYINYGGIVGAFNGIHTDGFTMPHHQLNTDTTSNQEQMLISFLRKRHSALLFKANSFLIPIHDEMDMRRANVATQFAAYHMNNAEAEDVVEHIKMWIVDWMNSLKMPMKH
jgi:hypothetical protein